jgi:DNA-binding protein HU-beta
VNPLNKTDLVKELARHAELSQSKASDIVDAIFDAANGLIVSQLKRGEKVVIPGFGTFFNRTREAHEARNPSTGAPIHVKAKNFPVFKPGKTLKETCEK